MILNEQAPAAVAVKAESGTGHWYSHEASKGWFPLYEPGKNYTLREARKAKAAGQVVVPSVTTIFRVLHKQMLIDWLVQQNLLCALKTPRSEYTSDDEWVAAVQAQADGSSRGAMDLGTRIHAAVEAAIGGGDYEADMDVYVQAVLAERARLGVKSIGVETCCGNAAIGYAGRCDEHAESCTIIDLKSRKSRKNKVASYSTDQAQTAAYGFALFGQRFFTDGRAIVIGISTTEPGVITSHEFAGNELVQAFDAFCGMVKIWKWENKWL